MSDYASISITDGIAVITMNDGKANAFSFAMMEALEACMDKAEAEADVIVLTAEGRAMSAGFDLKVMKNEPDRVAEMVTNGGKFLTRLFANKKPTIIAAPGHGIAAGGLLMLAADYRIAADGDGRFGLNETAIGMVLPDYGYQLALFRIDNKYLDASFVGADLFDVQTAIKAGFLDEAVPADRLMARAMEKAKAFQDLHPKAYAGNKRLVRGKTAEAMQAAVASGAGSDVNV
jgi:enoyl-CoA hydratase